VEIRNIALHSYDRKLINLYFGFSSTVAVMFLNEISPPILPQASKNLPLSVGQFLLMPIINSELKKKSSDNFFCGLPLISWVLLSFHHAENYDCSLNLK